MSSTKFSFLRLLLCLLIFSINIFHQLIFHFADRFDFDKISFDYRTKKETYRKIKANKRRKISVDIILCAMHLEMNFRKWIENIYWLVFVIFMDYWVCWRFAHTNCPLSPAHKITKPLVVMLNHFSRIISLKTFSHFLFWISWGNRSSKKKNASNIKSNLWSRNSWAYWGTKIEFYLSKIEIELLLLKKKNFY